jgi:hypothetical protein
MLAISLHGFGIAHGSWVGGVPLVHGQLNAIALGQQGQIHGRQVFHDAIKARPKGLAFDTHCRQDLIFNKSIKRCGHVESVNGNAIGHKKPQIKKQNKSKLNSTAGRNQKNNRSLNKPHFIRCFIIHKSGKYPLTCDFYAKMEAKCDKIGQNIVQP